jgi:hypothetical protein
VGLKIILKLTSNKLDVGNVQNTTIFIIIIIIIIIIIVIIITIK